MATTTEPVSVDPGPVLWKLAAALMQDEENLATLQVHSAGGPWAASATVTEIEGVVLLSVKGSFYRKGERRYDDGLFQCSGANVRRLAEVLTRLADGLEKLTALKAQES